MLDDVEQDASTSSVVWKMFITAIKIGCYDITVLDSNCPRQLLTLLLQTSAILFCHFISVIWTEIASGILIFISCSFSIPSFLTLIAC